VYGHKIAKKNIFQLSNTVISQYRILLSDGRYDTRPLVLFCRSFTNI